MGDRRGGTRLTSLTLLTGQPGQPRQPRQPCPIPGSILSIRSISSKTGRPDQPCPKHAAGPDMKANAHGFNSPTDSAEEPFFQRRYYIVWRAAKSRAKKDAAAPRGSLAWHLNFHIGPSALGPSAPSARRAPISHWRFIVGRVGRVGQSCGRRPQDAELGLGAPRRNSRNPTPPFVICNSQLFTAPAV